MKKATIIAALLIMSLTCAFAQENQPDTKVFKERYERLVRMLGQDGIGIETVLDEWAEVAPQDCEMLEARFNYYFERSRQTGVAALAMDKYLGRDPLTALKDSTGKVYNYFEINVYDDGLFALATAALRQAITVKPQEMRYRSLLTNAYIEYEKENPDIAESLLLDLIDLNKRTHPAWTLDGTPLSEDDFQDIIQQYCFVFFKEATPRTYDIFLNLSETMSKAYPGTTAFQANQGSYWLAVKNNPKKALKIYEKILKTEPDNLDVLKNCVIAARKMGDKALAGKYQLRYSEAAQKNQ